MIDLRCAVICIDDDPLILQVLAFQLNKILDTKSTLIEYYTNPSTAINEIDALVDEKIDIIFVLVDYQMPEMTGADLVRKIKTKYPALNCIMLSGQANESQVNELENENLLEQFIQKPWDEDELERAIKKVTKKK